MYAMLTFIWDEHMYAMLTFIWDERMYACVVCKVLNTCRLAIVFLLICLLFF